MLPIAFLLACGDATTEPSPPEPAAAADPHAADPHAAADPHGDAPSSIVRRGKVLETVPADSYTYARLDYCGQEAWVAGPKTELKVGGIVKMPEGSVQTNFESKALGRTLEYILFVNSFEMTDETEIDCSHLKPATAAAAPEEEEKPALHGKVLETMQSGGYTYALVETCGGEKRWAAGQQSVVKPDRWVTAAEVLPMQDFEAKSLGRVFDEILFVPRFQIVAEGPECE